MKPYVSAVIFTFTFAFCGFVAAQTASVCSPENRWALIVVAETSSNDSAARQSAESIEDSLRNSLESAGFPKGQIIVLTPDSRNPLARPTRENILAQMQWIKRPENRGPLPNQARIRQADEACEVFVYIQMLGMKHGERQYFRPVGDDGKAIPSDKTVELLAVSDISEALAQSTVERRLLVMNILSPVMTRSGSSRETIEGIDSKAVLREVPIPVARAGFGQIVVNDQLSANPGTIDSFADIFLRGLSGYADTSLEGNRDRCVTLRELAEYLEHYGNMASAGSVKTMLSGHDYPISAASEAVSKSVSDSGTKEMLEQVGKNLMNPGRARTPDYESAADSFLRAAVRAGTGKAVVRASRNTLVYPEKGGRSGRRLAPSDSLRLLKYEKGWFHVECGWIRANTVVALDVVEEKR